MTTLAEQIPDRSTSDRPFPGGSVQLDSTASWADVIEGYRAAIARLIEIIDGYALAAEEIKAERDRVKQQLEQILQKRMAV